MSEGDAINIFVDLVESGNCPDDSLEVEHILRGYRVEKISPNRFRISVERHPHLFGRPSKGMQSSAFATVKRTYELDTETQKINFLGEEVVDIEINYYALVEEDFSPEMYEWWIDAEQKNELAKLETKEEALDFAEKLIEINKINEPVDAIYSTSYELPTDFKEKLIDVTKEIFIHKVMEEWKWLKKYSD